MGIWVSLALICHCNPGKLEEIPVQHGMVGLDVSFGCFHNLYMYNGTRASIAIFLSTWNGELNSTRLIICRLC